MATIRRFEDIEAWRLGRELVNAIYMVTKEDLFSKDWGLKDQIRRAAVSVCSNIAEGFERNGNREFIKFLWIAKGSAGEVASQLYHAKDAGYIQECEFNRLYDLSDRIRGKLCNFIEVLRSRLSRVQNLDLQTQNPEPRTHNSF